MILVNDNEFLQSRGCTSLTDSLRPAALSHLYTDMFKFVSSSCGKLETEVCNLFQLSVVAKTNFDNTLSFDDHVLCDLFSSIEFSFVIILLFWHTQVPVNKL